MPPDHRYDGDGSRLQKSSGKIYWYGAGTEILDESDASGNVTAEYAFFGGKRVAMDTITGTGGGSISSTYYYADDFLGSSRTMVQTGGTSACFDADFLPFGREKDNVATCTQNDYKFEGKERDAETGNDDFGARYYSSNFGRWLSPDWSSIPEPVPYANLTNPQTLNLYAMVQDNPESFADLDGHVNTPGTADQTITCDVTTAVGCTEDQTGEINDFNIRNALGEDIKPDQMAYMINQAAQPGDRYALVFTPTVKVAICLKDVAACQEKSEGMLSKLGQAFDSMLTSVVQMRQAEEGWFGKHPNLERAIIIAGFVGGAGEAEEGAVGEGSVAQPNPNGQFVVAPNGTAIRIPSGYEAEPAANGNGIVYRPKGSTGDANTIRIMGPDSQGRYPNGYVRVYNRDGQPIDPLTGRQGNSPATQHTSF